MKNLAHWALRIILIGSIVVPLGVKGISLNNWLFWCIYSGAIGLYFLGYFENRYLTHKSDCDLVEKAFSLLIYDVDMSSVDESIFENVFNEMCDKKCSDDKNCRDCLKEYYIEEARRQGN